MQNPMPFSFECDSTESFYGPVKTVQRITHLTTGSGNKNEDMSTRWGCQGKRLVMEIVFLQMTDKQFPCWLALKAGGRLELKFEKSTSLWWHLLE